MKEPLVLSHSMTVRCTGVSAKASTHKTRTERIFTVGLAELDERHEGLSGAATLRDVPHDLARLLSEGLSPNRTYELAFTLTEIPEKQRDLFRDQAEDTAAATNDPDKSEPTISLTHKGTTVTSTLPAMRSALDRVKRTHRPRSH